jgi:hypothetical protein
MVTYPSNANGANANIGGLPFPVSAPGGAVSHGYGVSVFWRVLDGSGLLLPYDITSSTPKLNSALSGSLLIFSGTYLTP